ncbi:HAD hydrolase family protein, partial [Erysipelatoclostridium ramosum]|uniref:HAD family hydrolase n=2 Tax=Bacillota TaxID=1239 RepID=UPI001D06D9EB
ELLQVQPKQTMVFGDNFNDATMFSESGICVCMENGQPEVKEKADYIAKANTEQGVSRFLKEYVLR